jgi:hypothetical protein
MRSHERDRCAKPLHPPQARWASPQCVGSAIPAVAQQGGSPQSCSSAFNPVWYQQSPSVHRQSSLLHDLGHRVAFHILRGIRAPLSVVAGRRAVLACAVYGEAPAAVRVHCPDVLRFIIAI